MTPPHFDLEVWGLRPLNSSPRYPNYASGRIIYTSTLCFGGMGIRTPDLLIANETLYQLSYTPNEKTLMLTTPHFNPPYPKNYN